MKSTLFSFAFLFSSTAVWCQMQDFSTLERLNLIRIMIADERLSQHMEPNIHLWGELPMQNDTTPKWDSVKRAIKWRDANVTVDPEGLAHDDVGMTWEVARYMAMFHLDQVIKKGKDSSDRKGYHQDYLAFINTLEGKLPRAAFDHKGNRLHLIDELMEPKMTFQSIRVILEQTPQLKHADRYAISTAIWKAYHTELDKHTMDYYQRLGGRSQEIRSILLASGSGSSSSIRTFEKELWLRDEKYKRLRRGMRFIPYETHEYKVKDVQRYGTKNVSESRFRVKGGDTTTRLHLTTLGLPPLFQTTVVVEYKGHHYRLFGNEQDRTLSPVFKPEKDVYTYYSNIEELREVHIADLMEMIYGKRGYDYWIEWWQDRYHWAELRVEKSEKSLTHVTMDYKPGKVKKPKRKDRDIHPDSKTTPPLPSATNDYKKKGDLQNDVMYYYGIMEEAKAQIAELTKKKEEALEQLGKYQRLLEDMESIYGRAPRQYKKVKDVYVFDDGTVWDPATQNLTFPKSDGTEFGVVKLLSYGPTVLGGGIEDFFISGAVLEDMDHYRDSYHRFINQSYASGVERKDSLFTIADSIRVMDLSRVLASSKSVQLVAEGLGIGQPADGRLAAAQNQKALAESSEAELSVHPWSTEIMMSGKENVRIEIRSCTPGVQLASVTPPEDWAELNATDNQLLSALRARAISQQLVDELIGLMQRYAPSEYRSKAISNLKKAAKKGVLEFNHHHVGLQ